MYIALVATLLQISFSTSVQSGLRSQLSTRASEFQDYSAEEIRVMMAELNGQLQVKENDATANYLQVTSELSDTTGSDSSSTETTSSNSTSSDSADSNSTNSSANSDTSSGEDAQSTSSGTSASNETADSSSSSTNSTDSSEVDSDSSTDDTDSVKVDVNSDEDGYATVDVNDSQADYANGEQATYNYTVSIYEDDDDLNISVEDYSTSEASQNISSLLKRAGSALQESGYELADAYDAYYDAKKRVNEELGQFKEAVVYAEDVYIRIINYDSDADEYQVNSVTYQSNDYDEDDNSEETESTTEETEGTTQETESTTEETYSEESTDQSNESADTTETEEESAEDQTYEYIASDGDDSDENRDEDSDESSEEQIPTKYIVETTPRFFQMAWSQVSRSLSFLQF